MAEGDRRDLGRPMPAFSVIVTTCNNGAVLPNALRSVEEALAFWHERTSPVCRAPAEVLVVDDGSTDDTAGVLQELACDKHSYQVVRRPRPSSPACARNMGARAARGKHLFFLDADDLFLPEHLHVCLQEMTDPAVDFVKTGVALADPVHPDWKQRIEHSVVINLCVRRACHVRIGGFLDYHLFAREGDTYHHEADLFWKWEDQYYTELLARVFRGVGIQRETVRHLRYPGNSFDRQYAKFCRPFGAYSEARPEEECFRLALCEAIFAHRLRLVKEPCGAAETGRSGGRFRPLGSVLDRMGTDETA